MVFGEVSTALVRSKGGGDRISSVDEAPRISASNCPTSLILNKEHHSSKSQNI